MKHIDETFPTEFNVVTFSQIAIILSRTIYKIIKD